VISGFHREVAKNCTFLGYYAATSGNFLPTFRDNLSSPSLNTEDGTDRLSRNVAKKFTTSNRVKTQKNAIHSLTLLQRMYSWRWDFN